jgi:hypothetical protein
MTNYLRRGGVGSCSGVFKEIKGAVTEKKKDTFRMKRGNSVVRIKYTLL